jgi:tRNA A-37 threonylcarbamoyl transferase component Bud32/ABC-type branched-subunit amino acid transport system substrate-binding protein
MGHVYAAYDPSLDRRVALKLLRPEVATTDLEVRLLREAKAMARVTHPHVIAVYDAGRYGAQVYIAMEFVAGGTLREWLQRAPRTWREIVDVFGRAGDGLAEAHAAGIVHRDFKPDNVLIGDDGKAVRVTDFGLARAVTISEGAQLAPTDVRTDANDSSALDAELTRTGALVGTPVYMAPEQHAGRAVDARSDVFSFCVALYEALYGERPFASATLLGLYGAKLANDVRPAPRGTTVPQRVRRVILSGLVAEPSLRPQSMAELLAALRRATRRPRLPWIVAGGLLAGAAAAAVYGGARERARSDGAPVLVAAPCSNARCVKEHGGAPWVCRASDHQCVPIETERCKARYEPEDLEAADTVWLGALFPQTGPIAEIVRPQVEAVELARREFAQATRALGGPNPSLHVRRVAVVLCDDGPSEGIMQTAEHLVNDVGVPAVLGFRSGREAMDLAGGLLIQRRVVTIATLSPSAQVTQVPQPADLPRMVWRTTFGFTEVATATAAFVRDYFEPRRTPSAAPSRVLLVRNAEPGGVAFGQALLKSLVFNGKSAVENGERYQEISLPPEFVPDAGAEQVQAAAQRIVAMAPTFIVGVFPSLSVRLAEAIEAAWPRTTARPTYFLAANGPDPFVDFLGASAERRHRFFGVVASSTSAANAHFVIRFNEANADKVSRTENPGASYDAFYLLAFAANAGGREALDGVVLSRAFGRLVQPGRPIEVGPTDVFEALSELAQDHSIDLEGAYSTLDFDVGTGETASDYALLCADVDGSGAAKAENVASGVSYVARAHRASGSLACP